MDLWLFDEVGIQMRMAWEDFVWLHSGMGNHAEELEEWLVELWFEYIV